MGIVDTIKNILFGTERVNASKAECKTKKKTAEDKYKEEVKRIEAECEASLMHAKEADKAASIPTVATPIQTVEPKVEPKSYATEPLSPPPVGGKKGGKSKKRSKSNRKKTARKY